VDLRLDGKSALITGASRGIGLAIARRFAEAGADVMLSSRHHDALVEAAGTLEGLDGRRAVVAAHAGDPAQAQAAVAATLETFGRLDVLVNNAGTNPHFGPMLDIDLGAAQKTVEVNQLGVLAWVQAAAAGLAEHGGSVINMSSVGGLVVDPGIGWYNVTKAALIHLTRHLALELGPAVRVNALAPGLIKTKFARALWEPHEDQVAARLPLRRLGVPDDVATAALFLASDAASWITGQTLVVDGGSSVLPNGSL
jgi:NAD(P)-dependent dehydrogenase (short-subunit alcohol dehydrogenase family)